MNNWLVEHFPAIRRIYGFSLRHLYPLKRDFDLLTDMLYWPVIDIILWGVTSQWLSTGQGNSQAITTVLMGLIFWNIIWRSQSEISRNLIDEIWNNNLVNLFSTPLSLKEWVFGVLLLSLMKMIFTISFIVPIIYILYAVNLFMLGWWVIPFFIGAIITGWWVGFISAGIVIYWGPKVQTVVWTLPAILLPFSVVFFPLAILPTFLHPISFMLPTTYIFESIRAIILSDQINLNYLIISFGLNFLYLGLAVSWFVSQFNKSVQLGLGRFN